MTSEQYKQWREKLGLTHAQAAKELGVSERASKYYASGGRSISKAIENMCRTVAKKYRITP